jgi:molybdate transport system substrate-binding protein
MTYRLAALALAALLLAVPAGVAAQRRPELTIYGASDLTFAFKELAPRFEQAVGVKVTLVLGSTGNLAKQIEHGAPADVFFAADRSFVDDLAHKDAVIPATRALYAQGRIVLVTAKTAAFRPASLRELLDTRVRHLAIAHPQHAPYGKAAEEALRRLGLWDALRPRLVYGENIRHALQFVESGAAEAGIVALSVALGAAVDHVPIDPALHSPLDQACAVVRRSAHPELALAFIQFVNGPDGRTLMKRYGFLLPGEF